MAHVAVAEVESLSTATKLDYSVLAGATMITLRTVPHSGFIASKPYAIINPYSSTCEVQRVSNSDEDEITLSGALTYAHRPGTRVVWSTGLLDIRHFGAKDGADSTTAIQAALDAASGIAGAVYVPNGTFLASGLTYKSNTIIIGDGWGSVIKLKDASNVNVFRNYDVGAGNSNVIFENFKIDCNKAGQSTDLGTPRHGIACYQASNILINGMWIVDPEKDCIYLGVESFGGVGSGPASNIRIIGNYLYGSHRHGIGITSARDVIIQGNTISTIDDLGIDMEPNSAVVDYIERIQINGNSFYNIGLDPFAGAGNGAAVALQATGNKFRNINVANNNFWGDDANGYRGVTNQSANSENITITGNTFGGYLNTGILIAAATNRTTIANNVIDTLRDVGDFRQGIRIQGGADNVAITGNIVNNFYYSIGGAVNAPDVLSNITVTGNVVSHYIAFSGGTGSYLNIKQMANTSINGSTVSYDANAGSLSAEEFGTVMLRRAPYAVGSNSAHETIIAVTNTDANRTITLPTAQMASGRIYVVKDESGGAAAHNITVATEGAETIDGVDTATINADYGTVRLYSNGSNWYTF